jgi:hypothetical protein
MAKTIKRQFKLFGLWAYDKEARWLEAMAARGWRLQKVHLFFYEFAKAEPQGLRYYIDLKLTGKASDAEYEAIFKDAGWNLVSSSGLWRYFVTAPGNKYAYAYSDNNSLLKKFRALVLVHIIALAMLSTNLIILSKRLALAHNLFLELLMLLVFLLFTAMAYSLLKLIRIAARLNRAVRE